MLILNEAAQTYYQLEKLKVLWGTVSAQLGLVAQEVVWIQTVVFQCMWPMCKHGEGRIYYQYCIQPPGVDVELGGSLLRSCQFIHFYFTVDCKNIQRQQTLVWTYFKARSEFKTLNSFRPTEGLTVTSVSGSSFLWYSAFQRRCEAKIKSVSDDFRAAAHQMSLPALIPHQAKVNKVWIDSRHWQ